MRAVAFLLYYASPSRLLLVKVSDSPERCSIIDNLERGQIVTVSNLILCEPQSTFGFAMGNQHTTVAKYPKNRLLMEALDVFKQQIPQVNCCDAPVPAFTFLPPGYRAAITRVREKNRHLRHKTGLHKQLTK